MHLFKIRPIYGQEGERTNFNFPREKTYKYNEVIQHIGFGPYQFKIIGTIALWNLSLGIYIALLSFLIPLYKKDINITKWEVGVLISTQGLGSLLGGVFFSYLSDMFGRKWSLIAALLVVSSCSVVSICFDTFPPFCFVRFIAAVGYGGVTPVGITYMTEYLPDDRRGFYIMGIDIFKNLGGLITTFVGWMSGDDWRTFVLSPVPFFIVAFLVIIIFLPESSRYLLYKNKVEELWVNMNDMCKQNGKNFEIRYSFYDADESKRHLNRSRKVSICKDLIVKNSSTTFPLLLLWFFPAFGTGVFVFLPEIMLMKDFTMDEIYFLSAYLMIVPMIGVIISSWFVDMFGRKQLISLWALIAGLSLLLFTLIPNESNKLKTYFFILGIFAVFMRILKSVTVAYTPELYSTSIRTTALGVMSGADRAASILQPVIFTSLVYSSFRLAMGAFGLTYIIGFFVSMFLTEETSNKPLKESFLSEVSENDIGASGVTTSMVADT